MDQLPRLGKRELICLLLFTCNYVVSVWRGFLFLWVLGMGYVILLWHSLSLPLIIMLRNELFKIINDLSEFQLHQKSLTLSHPPRKMIYIYSASMKNHQYPNFDIIHLDSNFYVHVSGQRHTGLETKTRSTIKPWNYGARDSRAVCGFRSF